MADDRNVWGLALPPPAFWLELERDKRAKGLHPLLAGPAIINAQQIAPFWIDEAEHNVRCAL